MRVLRTIAISTALAAAAAIPGTLPAAAGGPTTEHFPACAPIPATPSLQECLDAVQTGSTSIIDTDDAADQLVFIQRPPQFGLPLKNRSRARAEGAVIEKHRSRRKRPVPPKP